LIRHLSNNRHSNVPFSPYLAEIVHVRGIAEVQKEPGTHFLYRCAQTTRAGAMKVMKKSVHTTVHTAIVECALIRAIAVIDNKQVIVPRKAAGVCLYSMCVRFYIGVQKRGSELT
jgi:hypothetical protein